MRILITNDDGIDAPALPALASRLAQEGHDVLIAAPLEGHSGCGASIGKVTEGQLVSVTQVSLGGAEGISAFAVDGPPAFIVLGAVQGVFGPRPDVVVTGPNSGLNLGPLVLHSGTFGAAMTAASCGVPGIALSTEKRARFGFTAAAEFCAQNLDTLLNSMGKDSVLNINVPDLPLDQIAGIRSTNFAPASLVSVVISEGDQPAEGKRQMRVSLKYDADRSLHRQWRTESGGHDESDAGAIVDGFISMTVVHSSLRHIDDRKMPQKWQGLQ